MTEKSKTCPEDDVLLALLHSPASLNPEPELAEHLETCGRCRSRLDEFAGRAPEFGCFAQGGGAHAPSSLQRVIERLNQEAKSAQTGSGAADPSLDMGTDPGRYFFLGPPGRPDSIGTFGGCEILERVGAGGMGIVFKAIDPALSRVVAIKALLPALAASERARVRFLREARAAAAVVHENVVAIHAVGEERTIPYFVMHFVHGRSLESRLKEGPLSLTQILRIGMQTASALAAAHKQGLIHRDIKPGNILLENGVERVKLTDFGLARTVDEPALTRAGVVAGTPEYMSPEQAIGEKLDARSDLFSLGAVLYAMATGSSPFAAKTSYGALKMVCESIPRPVHEINPDLPPWFGELVGRLLEKSPSSRIQTSPEVVELLRAQLERLQSEAMISPTNQKVASPPETTFHRSRMAWLLGATLLAVSAVWMWHLRFQPVSNHLPAVDLIRPDQPTTRHNSLAAAVAAAKSGDILELSGKGVLSCDNVAIHGKSLRIRASASGAPTLVSKSADTPLITSTAPLILEGLELRAMDGDSDVFKSHMRLGSDLATFMSDEWTTSALDSGLRRNNALVQISGARFLALNCRFVGSSRTSSDRACIRLEDVPEARLYGCEIYRANGVGVYWRLHSPSETKAVRMRPAGILSLEHCIGLGAMMLLVHVDRGSSTRLEINHDTLAGYTAMGCIGNGDVEVESQMSVYDVMYVARRRSAGGAWGFMRRAFDGKTNFYGLLRGPNAGQRARLAADNPLALPNREIGSYLGRARIISELHSLGTNQISAMDFRIEPSRLLSTPGIPTELNGIFGAKVEQVGPGPAYQAFRTSNGYSNWVDNVRLPKSL